MEFDVSKVLLFIVVDGLYNNADYYILVNMNV